MTFRRGCYFVVFIVAAVTILNVAMVQAGKSPSRVKRNLFQFGQMIRCETGRSPWDYNNYGCYCGLGGSGKTVDGVDECCRQHDACYDRIIRNSLCDYDFDVYIEKYNRDGCSGCGASNDACQAAICECDGTAARCFAKNTYNPSNKNYPKSQC